jgi:hypothetical protein
MSSSAFVDTTVLANHLLKDGAIAKASRDALRSFPETLLPVYALKELRAGPLSYFVWIHNRLASGTLAAAIGAIARVSGRAPGRAATGAEALEIAARSAEASVPTNKALAAQHGLSADPHESIKAEWVLHLRRIILRAWKRRRQQTTKVVAPLACFTEHDPRLTADGLIDFYPIDGCGSSPTCTVAMLMARERQLVRLLRDAIPVSSTRDQDVKRRKALKHLIKRGESSFTGVQCRQLGDAVIAFLAPKGSVILTTNVSDLAPLATALSKSAQAP